MLMCFLTSVVMTVVVEQASLYGFLKSRISPNIPEVVQIEIDNVYFKHDHHIQNLTPHALVQLNVNFWHVGTTQFLKNAPRIQGQMKLFRVGSRQFRESLHWTKSCSENCGFRVAQVVRRHSENRISYSENCFLNSESCSENALELSQSSENGLFTPRAFFLKLGCSPGF